MSSLDKAREWAESVGNIEGLMPGTRATVEVIQSLPDQWVDAEKLREIAEDLECLAQDSVLKSRFVKQAQRLRNLLTPKLPTLADMTPEERAACQWMQARFKGNAPDFVISEPGRMESRLWAKSGTTHIVDNRLITPLPGEPKLEWPGNGDSPTIAQKEKVAVDQEPNSSETPKGSIKPEDVPADELWLVEHVGLEFLAKRNREDAPNYPWFITSVDGMGSGIAGDVEITLIHKLVPETHALPEGMRLADHPDFGRVVVSPWVDDDEEYKVFSRDEDLNSGAGSHYAKKRKLTFLDGGK